MRKWCDRDITKERLFKIESLNHIIMFGKDKERLIVDFDDVLINADNVPEWFGMAWLRLGGSKPYSRYSTNLVESWPTWTSDHDSTDLTDTYTEVSELPVLIAKALSMAVDDYIYENGEVAA